MIREVNNTFKNLLRAKGCQSIYKHTVEDGGNMRVWSCGAGIPPRPPSQAGMLTPATRMAPPAAAWARALRALQP